MSVEQKAECAVGDLLAFRHHYGTCKWSVHEVVKVTPTGRIKCGPYTLDHDFRIRGKTPYIYVQCEGHVTDSIKDEIRRHEIVSRLRNFDWTCLSTESLELVWKETQ